MGRTLREQMVSLGLVGGFPAAVAESCAADRIRRECEKNSARHERRVFADVRAVAEERRRQIGEARRRSRAWMPSVPMLAPAVDGTVANFALVGLSMGELAARRARAAAAIERFAVEEIDREVRRRAK